MASEISINIGEIKKVGNNTVKFLKQKKVINILLIILFLALLIGSSAIRLQNLPLLKDQTTGEYIPLALDPFYFLRIAETIEANDGSLPEYDSMRYPSAKVGFSNEILPQAVFIMYKFYKIFDSGATIQFVNVVSPVIFFFLGLIIFFFLIYSLTNSKITALISSLFLGIIPSYLYRTMAGFSDHEAIGMFAFFLVLLAYSLSMKFLDKKENKDHSFKSILYGLVIGFLSAFAVASWGGGSNFIFMIIPLSFIVFWLLKTQSLEELDNKRLNLFLYFYGSWFLSTILFGFLYGFSPSFMMGKVFLSSASLINGIVFLFLLSDFLVIKQRKKLFNEYKEKIKKYRLAFSALLAIVLGIIIVSLLGENIFSFFSEIIGRLFNPFGGGRTSLTVAENKQPFLNDWVSQTGKTFFWLFLGGLVSLGVNISRKIKKNKEKIILFLLWLFLISGILFSRISSSHLFNGENFISSLFYFLSIVLFFSYLIYLYSKEKIRINPELIILFSWMFFILISAKGAVRLLFAITPFVCFSSAYLVVNLFSYFRKSKEEFAKMMLGILLIIVLIISLINVNGFVIASKNQSKYTGPSANMQWQSAMKWVRENTAEGSIFVHWWDYGYWVEYLGQRPSVTDGGHAVGYWDHLIGRYLLTTPDSNAALSFMKTHNVSYLLIDQTELGKYPAYSKIGSNEYGEDRFGQVPTLLLNRQQSYENNEGMFRVYNGGFYNDEDIIYDSAADPILLPSNKAAIGAIIIPENENEIGQPQIVFVYNGQQISIPLRYVYYKGEFIDFGEGYEAGIRIVQTAAQVESGMQIDELGSLIYLSPKVFKSLIGQLYLFENSLGNYDSIKLVHSETDSFVKNLKTTGADISDFVYFNGFRGPIRIWEVDYPSNIKENEEFLRTSGDYAEFDNLTFVL